MIEELLPTITQTIEGYPVKDLRFLPLDNIIVGLVKDTLYGNPNLREGYVSAQWNRYGKPIKLNKGREDLKLQINYE